MPRIYVLFVPGLNDECKIINNKHCTECAEKCQSNAHDFTETMRLCVLSSGDVAGDLVTLDRSKPCILTLPA